jgi:NAD+ kinase
MTSYAADGLLAATPTGSTGSNLAAGGPVLPPNMAALVLVPVLPFVSFRNSLVLPAHSRVDVQVEVTPAPPLHEAVLSIDGGITVPVEDGDRLTFTGSDVRCRFARLRPRHYFHAMLVSKLQRAPILPPLPADTPSPARP